MTTKAETNKEIWRRGCQKLACVEHEGPLWKIENLRDFTYPEGDEESPKERWKRFNFALHDIQEAFLYTVPFFARGIAHVMIGFKIKDKIIVASPELRYPKSENVSFKNIFYSLRAILGKNPLCYVWGTADDLVYVRQHVRVGEPVFAMPLQLSRKGRIKLFKGLAKRTNLVNHTKIEKYHALLNSCSHNVIHHLEQAGISFRPTQKIFYAWFPANISERVADFAKKMSQKVEEAKVRRKLRKKKKRRFLSRV